jgi:hypothetical protein
MKDYKKFKILENIATKENFIFIIDDDVLIKLPTNFKISSVINITLKKLKVLGYKVKGYEYLSQKTGESVTCLFIKGV